MVFYILLLCYTNSWKTLSSDTSKQVEKSIIISEEQVLLLKLETIASRRRVNNLLYSDFEIIVLNFFSIAMPLIICAINMYTFIYGQQPVGRP